MLRLFFASVLVVMLGVTIWAGSQTPLWSIPRSVGAHPWFIATLFDAYCGFFTFFAWQCYKEPSWLSRGLWFVALILLGNIAMATYGLAVITRAPRDARADQILLRNAPLSPALPATLIGAFVALTLVLRAI